MGSTNEIRDLDIEWGIILKLVDKISEIEESIEGGWDELIVMMTDAIDEEGEKQDPISSFFDLYSFLFRLYYRLKANPQKRPFNQYSHVKSEYWIENYNYKAFLWAKHGGYDSQIDNSIIKISEDSLSKNDRRVFESRCKKGTK